MFLSILNKFECCLQTGQPWDSVYLIIWKCSLEYQILLFSYSYSWERWPWTGLIGISPPFNDWSVKTIVSLFPHNLLNNHSCLYPLSCEEKLISGQLMMDMLFMIKMYTFLSRARIGYGKWLNTQGTTEPRVVDLCGF